MHHGIESSLRMFEITAIDLIIGLQRFYTCTKIEASRTNANLKNTLPPPSACIIGYVYFSFTFSTFRNPRRACKKKLI